MAQFIVHKVKPGETLAILAKRYYGDYQKFIVIADFNRIEDVAKIPVGSKIKIPEIEGIVLAAQTNDSLKEPAPPPEKPRAASDPPETMTEKKPDSVTTAPLPEEPTVDIEGQTLFYRDMGIELFYAGQYEAAIDEFKKVLAIDPDESIVRYLCAQSYLRIAKGLLARKAYLAARDQFRKSLDFNADCIECHRFIETSEQAYKETHYKKGMQYFGNEQLTEAIWEWEQVLALDPDYKRVSYQIEKARTILKKLDEIRNAEKG